ncbi:hypothetical protein CTEN210_08666 [Chaetoceros tenuissimus]|uniref:25S rRNA (uridine-N(3))-methyltransferase BMT5-like domain-containing protein n=1 Tax=Chaetoceros tenuissimus TaxID=426638 RepID=A0AAD3H6H0_9STRA|nr:hypothetical protein CTEN210_08666 [Chaetoceros tenuissimus]
MSFRALTIGDGDFSFSLALKRAYPDIHVTATTLIDNDEELYETYSNSKEIVKEFRQVWNETIIMGTDGTKIEESIHVASEEMKYDIILFNHPHLGDAVLQESEQKHAERHYILLSHYFHSAKKLLKQRGRIHVCLCGQQPTTWDLMKAAENSGLILSQQDITARPIENWLFDNDDERSMHPLGEVLKHYPTARKFRNGKLGSKHFLARYGYRHRRTGGERFGGNESEMNVQQSENFVFVVNQKGSRIDTVEQFECNICRLKFDCHEELSRHLKSPALPDIALGTFIHEKNDQSLPCKKKKEVSSLEPRDINDTNTIVTMKVTKDYDGKRIKWLSRQKDFPLSEYIKSKSQCKTALKMGRIYINGLCCMDDSRIVRENDVIDFVEEYQMVNERKLDGTEGSKEDAHEVNNEEANVKIVKKIPSKLDSGTFLTVALKPVGIRCVGNFSPYTLEMILKKQLESKESMENIFCQSISKLDTGCSGLCPVIVSSGKLGDLSLKSVKVSYSFTVLVHGNVPKAWKNGVYCSIPKNGVRKWKRLKTEEEMNAVDSNDEPDRFEVMSDELDLADALFITFSDNFQVLEGDENTMISTLTVKSSHDDGRIASVISFLLRKLGFPVVNDRFCKRELSLLPRRMKNILKQKICIECNHVNVEYEGTNHSIEIEPHRRTQCSFWREIMYK